MVILYADDEQSARVWVSRALETKGHTVLSLDTSDPAALQADTGRVLSLLKGGMQLDLIILDGHNMLTNSDGRLLADVTPQGLLEWLYRNGLSRAYPLILYSNDPDLVAEIRLRNTAGFVDAICKVGKEGGLRALLEAVERLGHAQTA